MAAAQEETLTARCEIPIIDLAHIGESPQLDKLTTYPNHSRPDDFEKGAQVPTYIIIAFRRKRPNGSAEILPENWLSVEQRCLPAPPKQDSLSPEETHCEEGNSCSDALFVEETRFVHPALPQRGSKTAHRFPLNRYRKSIT